MEEALLSVRDLAVSFATDGGILRAVDGVSFDVPKGRAVALVGESGSGKSVTAQAILRLIPSPPGRIDRGEIRLEGQDLLGLSEREMCRVRGGRVGIVFQDPMTSLNPVYTVGFQIAEAIRLHRKVSRKQARLLAIEGLNQVGFPKPAERIDSFPHELSGGMRQRVLIAIALANSPALLIADEPTTSLDATIQAQILELLRNLRRSLGMSLLLISHDLGVVAQVADEIVVLYAGAVVERGPVSELLRAPKHPYTRALLRSIPPTGPLAYRRLRQKARRLPVIEGSPPDLRAPPPGCRFHPRCEDVMARCRREPPLLYRTGPEAEARCFLVDPSGGAA
jgi:peptide/nickel transport system ATP-binding protein